MPRTPLAVQNVTSSGLAPNFTAANVDGHDFAPRRGRILRVKNASAGAVTVTIPTPGTVDGLAITDRTITVPATTGDVLIGLGDGGAYRQNDGTAHVDFSAVASVTVALIDVP